MSDIVYALDARHSFDVTLEVTLGGGVINLGKKMDVNRGDFVILLYAGMVLGAAPVLSVESRKKNTLEVAHGRVGSLSAEQRETVDEMARAERLRGRGGQYLR